MSKMQNYNIQLPPLLIFENPLRKIFRVGGQHRDNFLQPAATDQNIRSDKQTYLRPTANCCKNVWMTKKQVLRVKLSVARQCQWCTVWIRKFYPSLLKKISDSHCRCQPIPANRHEWRC